MKYGVQKKKLGYLLNDSLLLVGNEIKWTYHQEMGFAHSYKPYWASDTWWVVSDYFEAYEMSNLSTGIVGLVWRVGAWKINVHDITGKKMRVM